MNIIILRLASKYSSCKTHLTKILHGHLKFIFSGNSKNIYSSYIVCLKWERTIFWSFVPKKISLEAAEWKQSPRCWSDFIMSLSRGEQNNRDNVSEPLKSYG